MAVVPWRHGDLGFATYLASNSRKAMTISNARAKRIVKWTAMILLVIFAAYVGGNIYLVYFWHGGWGESIVKIMYWTVRP